LPFDRIASSCVRGAAATLGMGASVHSPLTLAAILLPATENAFAAIAKLASIAATTVAVMLFHPSAS
jgi:hypothetical protein